MVENIRANITVDCDVIQRGGKDFVNVKNVLANLSIGHYQMQFESDSAVSLVISTLNRVVNSNWELMFATVKPCFDNIVGVMVKSIIAPIFNGLPIQDFYE